MTLYHVNLEIQLLVLAADEVPYHQRRRQDAGNAAGLFYRPFGALLSSGIFTSILQNYFTDVLKLDLGFLTTLQLVSTVLIVASNLIVGQLIEHTKALAGKARP